jgi:hypothetical protein
MDALYSPAARGHNRHVAEVTPTHLMELIDLARSGGPDAPAAARTVLEVFIGGSRDRRVAEYIARCLNDYLRGGTPIEFALHLSSALPPVVRGAAGEGDRRRSERASRSTHQDSEDAGAARRGERRHRGGRRDKTQVATDKGGQDKRSGARAERRRKPRLPEAADTD